MSRVKRSDCIGGQRPCRYTRCRYHLWIDAPSSRIEEMGETCALDVADRGRSSLDEIGQLMGLTRERIRQIEVVALRKLRKRLQQQKVNNEREAKIDPMT